MLKEPWLFTCIPLHFPATLDNCHFTHARKMPGTAIESFPLNEMTYCSLGEGHEISPPATYIDFTTFGCSLTRVYKVDTLICSRCGAEMKRITCPPKVRKILHHAEVRRIHPGAVD